jgi:hypothetical protein
MRTRLPLVVALIAGLAAFSVSTIAFAQESATTLTATLTGEAEVPGPGDPRWHGHRQDHPPADPGLLQPDLGQHRRRHPGPHPQGCARGGRPHRGAVVLGG